MSLWNKKAALKKPAPDLPRGPVLPALIADFLPLLLDHSNKIIFVKDAQFRIVYANRHLLDIYPPERRPHILGTTTVEAFSDEEVKVFLTEDRKAFTDGYAELTEEIIDYRGQKRWLRSEKIRFYDASGQPYILGLCDDITTYALREQELAQKNLALENFAAVAAHDLRSPLATVIAGLGLLEFSNKDLPKKSVDLIAIMKRTCEGLAQQVSGLLAVYKQTQQPLAVRPETDLKQVIEEVRHSLLDLMERNQATLLSGQMPEIAVDRHMFRQLFSNLVENSIKYRAQQKPVIIIRHSEDAQQHLFTVEDNGIGIKLENQHSVFGMYQQTEIAIDGVGIGMALCKKIVELHRGRIWVDPEYTEGCRICFTVTKT